MVRVSMPELSPSMARGERLLMPRFMLVGSCEAVVEAVSVVAGMLIVDLTIEVDGVYFAKVRGTKTGDETVWSPLRVEAAS